MEANEKYYWSAFYLLLAFGTTNIAFIFFLYFNGHPVWPIAEGTLVVIAIAFGISVQSNVARYVGGIWLLYPVVPIAFVLIHAHNMEWSIGVGWTLIAGCLSIATAYLLLISRRFSAAFREKRQSQSAYKKHLRTTFIALLVGTILVATTYEIYKLKSVDNFVPPASPATNTSAI